MKKMMFVVAGLALGLAFFVPSGNVNAAAKKAAVKDYDYQLIDQQPSGIITMQPGEVKTVWIEVKNTGTKTWYVDGPNPVRLGYGSLYADTYNTPGYNYVVSEAASFSGGINSWISFDRTAPMSDGNSITSEIKPGWNTRFQFDIKAPSTSGVYKEYFTPVVEHLAWMKDMGIYWDIRVLGANNYYPEEIYLWPTQGDKTTTAQIGDSIYVGVDTTNSSFFLDGNTNVLKYYGRQFICDGYNQNINMDINTCNTTSTRALYKFRAVANGVSDAGVQGFPSVAVTVGGNNNMVSLNNGDTIRANIGDTIKVTAPITYDSNSVQYTSGVLNYDGAPHPLCTNTECGYAMYLFSVVGDGFSRIDITSIGFSASIISDRDYYSTNASGNMVNAKKGDILIIDLINPGDGGYIFADPEFPAGRIKLIDHKRSTSSSGIPGDFGSDQWVFEIQDIFTSNYIQIRAYRPWTGGDSFTAFLLNINPVLPCASGSGCAL